MPAPGSSRSRRIPAVFGDDDSCPLADPCRPGHKSAGLAGKAGFKQGCLACSEPGKNCDFYFGQSVRGSNLAHLIRLKALSPCPKSHHLSSTFSRQLVRWALIMALQTERTYTFNLRSAHQSVTSSEVRYLNSSQEMSQSYAGASHGVDPEFSLLPPSPRVDLPGRCRRTEPCTPASRGRAAAPVSQDLGVGNGRL